MKRLNKLVLSIIIMVTILTGCSAQEYHELKIEKDKNVTIKTTIGMDDELLDSILKLSVGNKDREITDDMRWSFLDTIVNEYDSFNKERYEKDNYKGYILTYKERITLDDITSLTSQEERYSFISNIIKGSNMFIKNNNVYKSNIKVQVPDEYSAINNNESNGNFDMTFTLILPNSSISNNADIVSDKGRSLTWNITDSKNIDVEFTIKNTKLLLIIVIIIGVIFIISLIFMIKRKN